MTRLRLDGLVAYGLIGLISLSAGSAIAQTNEETFQQFQFNFSTPGARASAMGRAFVGLADDASAATINPAGLILLRKPQFYFEYKHTQLRSRRLAEDDSLTSGRTSTFYDDIDAFSYFNFTYPIRDKVALSFTRHEFLNFKETFLLGLRQIPGAGFPLSATMGERDFDGVSWGGSVAVAVHDKFSLGATLTLDQLDAEASFLRFAVLPDGRVRNDVLTTVDEEDTSFGITFGALYRPSYRFSIGAVYARGPRFDIEQRFAVNDELDPNVPLGSATSQLIDLGTSRFSFNVPDRFGLGLAGRPHDRLLLVFDANHVRYSNLVDSDFLVLENDINEAFGVGANPQLTAEDYSISNEWEVHAGFEWNVVQGRNNQAFLRGGVFTDPEHGLRFVGDSGDPILNDIEDAKFNFSPRNDDTGLTFGGGVTLGRQFQADAAWVSIDSFSEFILSVAIRLP